MLACKARCLQTVEESHHTAVRMAVQYRAVPCQQDRSSRPRDWRLFHQTASGRTLADTNKLHVVSSIDFERKYLSI